jgi:hypothetical protein
MLSIAQITWVKYLNCLFWFLPRTYSHGVSFLLDIVCTRNQVLHVAVCIACLHSTNKLDGVTVALLPPICIDWSAFSCSVRRPCPVLLQWLYLYPHVMSCVAIHVTRECVKECSAVRSWVHFEKYAKDTFEFCINNCNVWPVGTKIKLSSISPVAYKLNRNSFQNFVHVTYSQLFSKWWSDAKVGQHVVWEMSVHVSEKGAPSILMVQQCFLHWRWKQHVPPKFWYLSAKLRLLTSPDDTNLHNLTRWRLVYWQPRKHTWHSLTPEVWRHRACAEILFTGRLPNPTKGWHVTIFTSVRSSHFT